MTRRRFVLDVELAPLHADPAALAECIADTLTADDSFEVLGVQAFTGCEPLPEQLTLIDQDRVDVPG